MFSTWLRTLNEVAPVGSEQFEYERYEIFGLSVNVKAYADWTMFSKDAERVAVHVYRSHFGPRNRS